MTVWCWFGWLRYARTTSRKAFRKALAHFGVSDLEEEVVTQLLEGCINWKDEVDYKRFCRLWQ